MSQNATIHAYDTLTPVEGKAGTWRPVVSDPGGNLNVMIGQLPGILDITSAAITSTQTSSAIPNRGEGFTVSLRVTAVSGTTPTLDFRIEESFDNGNTWETLYELQRVTANGTYNTPVLRAVGSLIRYVRTVGGTSPSFTNSVFRTINANSPNPQKRRFDRTVSLTTLNANTVTLFAGSANNAQLVINIGAATTPPALILQGSEDGTNWYDIGTALTAVASSTVSLHVVGNSNTFLRARVSTAGVTVTSGYIMIKAWS